MSNNTTPKRHGPMGHGPRMTGEKAKDFKGTMKKLIRYLSAYKLPIFFVLLFAVGSAAFSIIGPKILGNATDEIFNGLIAKISGTPGAGIDFAAVGRILIFLLVLYACSAGFGFIQGYIMSGVTQRVPTI